MDDYNEINDYKNISNLKNLSDIAIDLEKKFNRIDVNNSNFSEETLENININIKLKNKIRKQIDIRYQLHQFYNYKNIINNQDFIEEYRENEGKLLDLLQSAINILQSLLNFENLNKGNINTSEEQTKTNFEINLDLDKEIIKLFSDNKTPIEKNTIIATVFTKNINCTEYI